MAKILAVGVATLDWIQVVECYPEPDSELRAQRQMLLRGGNATNTLTVLNQLEHSCSWLGTLADDLFSEFICNDLKKNRIDYSHCPQIKDSVTPTSHILLSQKTASRNIIHYRLLRELLVPDYENIDFSEWQWIHFEGRNIATTLKLMRNLKQQYPDITLSLEIEKPREGIEQLFAYADHCLFSRHYANSLGYDSPEKFLRDTQNSLNSAQELVCAWGERGATAISTKGDCCDIPSLDVKVVDTRAAGDVFNAAYIDARLKNDELLPAVEKACYLAGIKCSQFGVEGLVVAGNAMHSI